MQVMSWILTSSVCSIALVLCLVGSFACVNAELIDVQRQQLPFGELIFPVPERVSNESGTIDKYSSDLEGLEIRLPKIDAMADSHTDDGSVISRHYSATLVESAWRNRLNNSTMAYFFENTQVDVSALSLFAAFYLSSLMFMSFTRKA